MLKMEELEEIGDESNHRGQIYLAQNSFQKFYRVKLMDNGQWFALDEGTMIKDNINQLFLLPNSLFETYNFLSLVKMDKIVPDSIDTKSTKLYFSILTRALNGAQGKGEI